MIILQAPHNGTCITELPKETSAYTSCTHGEVLEADLHDAYYQSLETMAVGMGILRGVIKIYVHTIYPGLSLSFKRRAWKTHYVDLA